MTMRGMPLSRLAQRRLHRGGRPASLRPDARSAFQSSRCAGDWSAAAKWPSMRAMRRSSWSWAILDACELGEPPSHSGEQLLRRHAGVDRGGVTSVVSSMALG